MMMVISFLTNNYNKVGLIFQPFSCKLRKITKMKAGSSGLRISGKVIPDDKPILDLHTLPHLWYGIPWTRGLRPSSFAERPDLERSDRTLTV